MAGSNVIFRVTGAGDNETNVSDKIEFNTGGVPDANAKMTYSSWQMIRDVSPHPNPNTALTEMQDGLLGTFEITVAGYFLQPLTEVSGALLQTWQAQPGTIDTHFDKGRWGLRMDDMQELNLSPSATIGYLLYDVYVERPDDAVNEKRFILKFYRNGAI